jgi:hypothetical protein
MMRSSFTLKLLKPLIIFLLVGSGLATARAEEETDPKESPRAAEQTAPAALDTVDAVKVALEDFHQVMKPLWHESFPEQDYKTIREKAPLLREKLMTLIRVGPPAKLEQDEEKLRDYLGKRQELAFHVTQVNLAAQDGPDSTLASAFESMHWAYEELERVLAEPFKELESFHETLYFLWHKALPERDYQAIRETAQVLKAEADSLMKAPLPQNCKVKEEEFEKGKTALRDAVYQLAEKSAQGSQDDTDASLKLVHDKYVELNMLLR